MSFANVSLADYIVTPGYFWKNKYISFLLHFHFTLLIIINFLCLVKKGFIKEHLNASCQSLWPRFLIEKSNKDL